jgi:multisubunit Na+/H+ antiporter MnhB subunit
MSSRFEARVLARAGQAPPLRLRVAEPVSASGDLRSIVPPRAAPQWLLSRATDFWLVCAGGGVVLLVVALVLLWHGDHALGIADLLLAELHLGATYDVIARRRLWRRMPVDVIGAPMVIVAASYAVAARGWDVLLFTAVMYLGAWHRGRQNLGIARHYQRLGGALPSRWRRRVLAAAIYLPMAASVAFFTATSPLNEGDEYLAPTLPTSVHWALAALAVASLVVYLGSTTGRRGRGNPTVHPAERWLVVANALAFGSAYVVGAWTPSFILVLVLHHEVQYLAFTYAMAKRGAPQPVVGLHAHLVLLASFAIWPAVDVASWVLCQGWDPPDILMPFLTAGLLAHYWLDGRIWTARARRLAPIAS